MTTNIITAFNTAATKTQELIESGCQSDNPFVRTGTLAALFVATIFPGYPLPEAAQALPSTPDPDRDNDREVSGSMQLRDRVAEPVAAERRPPAFLADIRGKGSTTEDAPPPAPPAPPALVAVLKGAMSTQAKVIVPVSEEQAQEMIGQHKEITTDIQSRRVHIRGLEESNKGARKGVLHNPLKINDAPSSGYLLMLADHRSSD